MAINKKKTIFILATLLCDYSYSVWPEDDLTSYRKIQSPALILGMLVHRLTLQTPAQIKASERLHNIQENTLKTALSVTFFIGEKGAIPSFTAPWRFIEPLQDPKITKLNALLTIDSNSNINLIPESGNEVKLELETVAKMNDFLSAKKAWDHSASFIHFPTEERNMILTDAVKIEGCVYDFLNSTRTDEPYIDVPIQLEDIAAEKLYIEQSQFEDMMYGWAHTNMEKGHKLPPTVEHKGGITKITLQTKPTSDTKSTLKVQINKRNFTKEQIALVQAYSPHFLGKGPPYWINTELNQTRVQNYRNKSEVIKQHEGLLDTIKEDFEVSNKTHQSIMNNPEKFMRDNGYTGEQLYQVYLTITQSKYDKAIRETKAAAKYPCLNAELKDYLSIQANRYKPNNTTEDYFKEFTHGQPDLMKLFDKDEADAFCEKFKGLKDSYFNKENGKAYQGTGVKGNPSKKGKRSSAKRSRYDFLTTDFKSSSTNPNQK
jgi:hypothetical protein